MRESAAPEAALPWWLRLRPGGPFRPPDWRSLLAAEIAGHPDRRVVAWLGRWADARVLDLVRFGDRLPPDHPLVPARGLLRPDRHRVRVEVEARLLAGQSDEAITAATGVGAESVAWFHAALYDVRGRLHARGYVRNVVLGRFPGGGPDRLPLELARWFGYYGGGDVLQVILDLLKNEGGRPPGRTGVTAADPWATATRQAARAAILARLLPDEPEPREAARLLAAIRLRGAAGAFGPVLMGPLAPPTGVRPVDSGGAEGAILKLGKVAGLGAPDLDGRGLARATQRTCPVLTTTRVERAACDRGLPEPRP